MKKLNSLLLVTSLYLLTTGFANAAVLVSLDDEFGIPANRQLLLEPFGVMENDTLDGEAAGDLGVTVTLVTGVSKGVMTCPDNAALDLCPDGSFDYTPDASFDGFDFFEYQATAVSGETATATVTLSACEAVGAGAPTVTTCWHETPYLARLSALGYNVFQEGFEGTVWNSVRSPAAATSITSKGITWSTNHTTTNLITTGQGSARSGTWGAYDQSHGFATGTASVCDVNNPPLNCTPFDGLSGTGTALFAVGGYISGTSSANVAIGLDAAVPIGIGILLNPAHHFFGIIDTAGFSSFQFRELDGKIGQELSIFGDEFIIATTNVMPANNPPVLTPVGDKTVDENIFIRIDLTASDPDVGDSWSFGVSNPPAGSSFIDNEDGTATFSWRPRFDQAGIYNLGFSVTDNSFPAAIPQTSPSRRSKFTVAMAALRPPPMPKTASLTRAVCLISRLINCQNRASRYSWLFPS